MTKKELINNLRVREGMTWEQSKRIVNSLFDEISTAVVENGDMYIPKFGRFFIGTVAEKHCIHPVTREKVIMPAHPIIRFRMAAGFRRKLEK